MLFDREIDGRANPAELGLERFVFRKFSFMRKLVGLEILERPWPAHPGHPLARLTSECFSPVLQRTIGLGFVAPEHRYPGTLVRLRDARLARVARLPFYDPPRRLPRGHPL